MRGGPPVQDAAVSRSDPYVMSYDQPAVSAASAYVFPKKPMGRAGIERRGSAPRWPASSGQHVNSHDRRSTRRCPHYPALAIDRAEVYVRRRTKRDAAAGAPAGGAGIF
jgi:hypothetical protein